MTLGRVVAPLCLTFLICKMGITIAPTPKVCSEGSGRYWGELHWRFLANRRCDGNRGSWMEAQTASVEAALGMEMEEQLPGL